MESKRIIGIVGRIGSGKDTVANIITNLVAKEKGFPSMWKKGFLIPDTSIETICNKKYDSNGEYCGWQIRKFADSLKEIVCILTGYSREDLENQDFKNNTTTNFSYRNIVNQEIFYTIRELLQKIGTEGMRDVIDKDIWVKALFNNWKNKNQQVNWIISDVRFPNEVSSIEDKGGFIIRLSRNNDIKATHISETALHAYNYKNSYIIKNNGTLEELVNKVKTILKVEKIIK